MKRPRPAARIVRATLALALLAATVWLNVAILADAYGPGPPYHGRTVNMDKWTDPLPWLLPLDAVAIAVLLRLVRRKPGRPR